MLYLGSGGSHCRDAAGRGQWKALNGAPHTLETQGEEHVVRNHRNDRRIAICDGGIVAVPAPPPEASRLKRTLPRLAGIIADAQARAMLTTAPIAVVGLACRFPGAADLAAFWRLLEEGRDAIAEVPCCAWPWVHP